MFNRGLSSTLLNTRLESLVNIRYIVDFFEEFSDKILLFQVGGLETLHLLNSVLVGHVQGHSGTLHFHLELLAEVLCVVVSTEV